MHALPDGPWMLAFSGGPDSTGLAARLRAQKPLLAYVDHRMRGPRASRLERGRVQALAHALDLPLVRARLPAGLRGESAARRERYRVLHALARRHGCRVLAVAHSADDRAETVLFNLLRGTGLRGLSAPRPRACHAGIRRIRPALDERRFRLRAWAGGLPVVVDPTNRRTSGARARVRLFLLPALGRLLGEDPVPLLCGLADRAGRVRAALEERAVRLAPRAGRAELLAECEATFPYLVEALRATAGPPLTSRAYAALRAFLGAGRGDRVHHTPGGEGWSQSRRGGLRIRPADR